MQTGLRSVEEGWDGERLGRPGVWVAARALVLTLVVLLAVTFEGGGEQERIAGGMARGGWPFPLGYLTALTAVYLASAVYLAVRRRSPTRGALFVLLVDVPVVTALVHWTGGVESYFVPVYVPLALAGGMLCGVAGGLAISLAAAGCYLGTLGAEAAGWLLPRAYGAVAARSFAFASADVVRVALQLLVLVLLGLLAGVISRAFSERARALRTASRNLERARHDTAYVIEHLASGILSLDDGGRVVLLNRAAGAILGIEPAAGLGRPLAEALPPGARSFVDWLERARRGRAPLVRQEVEIERPGDTLLPLGMTGSRTGEQSIGEPGGLIVLFQDLTRARAEEAERVRQERLAVIGGLAGGIAHEIRNCVKPISGSLDMLLRDLELAGPNARLMQLAVRECGRLGHFVQAMLDYGRVNPLAPQPVRLDVLVEEVADLLGVVHESAHAVEVAITAEARGGEADADREQLKQVLLNLALNGLEAMGEHPGTLTLGLQVIRDAQAEQVDDGRGVAFELAVSDTGPGMDAETAAQIFEPFFTTKQGGTGFGLAIAASIVERHGGVLEVESAPGAGALFRVHLRERAEPEETLAA